MKYTVENTATEKRSQHKTWSAAMRAAAKAGDEREVVIIERDRDGERTYNQAGQIMSRDGHFPKGTHLDKFTGQPTKSYPCSVCGVEMGWDTPSGACSQSCLEKGQGFSRKAKFGDVPTGTFIRLENCYGTKVDPVADHSSAKFYADQGARFDGWNFRYKFMGFGIESMMSLASDCEIIVLDKLPACY